MQNRVIFIVGPTAVGKTEVGFLLAKALKGEVVSCDAMQVYKGADIATNKPAPRLLKKVPHHLIGCVPLSRDFDVARFQKLAVGVIRKIQEKGKVPVLVGGSGLYVQVLLDGIFAAGEKDPRLREELERQAREAGPETLFQRLRQLDAAAAARIHPNDLRRVIRALEVCLKSEQPISQLQKTRRGLWGEQDILIFAVNRDRQELYERINRRVDGMFTQGLVEEVKRLSRRKLSRTAQQMIGVPEVLSFLRGDISLEEAKELLKRNTRRYAKRQLTWFRKDHRLIWLEMSPRHEAQGLVNHIIKEYIKKG